MGKPFSKELTELSNTYDWISNIEVGSISQLFKKFGYNELIAVGSGGSLSACHYMALLHFSNGKMARAITPLELHHFKNSVNSYNVIFISAGGRNKDILLGYKTVVKHEPLRILNICMRNNSPLARLSASSEITDVIELEPPIKKDGFLATNSLLAYFILLYRLYTNKNITNNVTEIDESILSEIDSFANNIDRNGTITVLYSSLSQPVAVDIESKFSEAGLGNILVSDYRNFGHGRHNWYDKRALNSSIVALVTPKDKKLAMKTLSFIPEQIPILVLSSDYSDSFASIDLLVKSFYLVKCVGEMNQIDPGRPGVPDFGSKLYNLSYASTLTTQKNKTNFIIERKLKHYKSVILSNERKEYEEHLTKFLHKLETTKFGSVIFDFDATLCSSEDRFDGINDDIKNELIKLLKNGIIIGVITGRGKSVRLDLQKKIPEEFWSNIIIGYYNGSDVGELGNNNLPDKTKPVSKELKEIQKAILSHNNTLKEELRPSQLTIDIPKSGNISRIKGSLREIVLQFDFAHVDVLESSHSIDIIDKRKASKLNIIPYCEKKAEQLNLPKNCLCIGDKGKWPGNDYLLLSTPYSLSVDEVSVSKYSCWNIAPPGIKNIKATLAYLSFLKFTSNGVTFKYS